MQKRHNAYEQVRREDLEVFDERALKIMQKAKVFGVDIFSNKALSRELIYGKFSDKPNVIFIKNLQTFCTACDNAMQKAQQSSAQ